MQIIQAAVLTRRPKSGPFEQMIEEYLMRSGRFAPCKSVVVGTEETLLGSVVQGTGRAAYLILCDSCGEQLSSEQFAGRLGKLRDTGVQRVVLAVGPADGWSNAARAQANLLLSFGRITLPHQLARVILAEQVYRALTILAGHPYHSGH